jgi:putative peptidoglycan lipid II flippase
MFAIREGAAGSVPRRPRTIARRVPTNPEPGPAPAPGSGDPGGGQPTEAIAPPPAADEAPTGKAGGRPPRILRNTAIFSVATGLSRIVGLVREVVAASLFGTSPQASAFTIAFQVPNLLRALVADAALSAAFVPVFTELLEKDRRRDAYQLAGALFGLILAVLGVITVVFFVAAPVIMPIFTGSKFSHANDELTVGLSRVLFPIVVLLGLNGLVVGVLNAYDHFAIPAIAPLVWNLVIIAGLVAVRGLFHGPNQIYAYAIGVLAGTVVQFAMALPVLRRIGFPLRISARWRDPRIKQVLKLMLPVTIGLGVINFDLLINSSLGTLVSAGAPRAIDAAFRIYMLPQGMFSVAVATVLFPQLSRLAARRDLGGLRRWSGDGMRLIMLILIPAAAFTIALATPITRLVYQRGDFGTAATRDVATALFWFSFSLPFNGMNLMLTRTFFSLQRPWVPTALACTSMVVNAAVSVALYRPLGIAGIVIGTAVSNAVMTLQQIYYLRRDLRGFEVLRTLRASLAMLAAAAALGGAAYGAWWLLDAALGRSLIAQVVSVGAGLAGGTLVYVGAVLLLDVPEAHMAARLVQGRLRRSATT